MRTFLLREEFWAKLQKIGEKWRCKLKWEEAEALKCEEIMKF